MSRGLTFWNDETIKLIKDNFVAASVPTWVCRAKSPEGEFLRGAGVDKQWVTSSGLHHRTHAHCSRHCAPTSLHSSCRAAPESTAVVSLPRCTAPRSSITRDS